MIKNKTIELVILSILLIVLGIVGFLVRGFILPYRDEFLIITNIILFILMIVMVVSFNYMILELKKECPHTFSIQELTERFRESSIYCKIMNEKNNNGGHFFVTTDDLMDIEKKTKANEVIVFTPEISMDIEDDIFSTIAHNINRGIKYSYFLPDNITVRGQARGFIEKLTGTVESITDKVKIKYLPENMIVSGITLHVGNNSNGGYVNIPNRKYEKNYFVVMDNYYFNRNLECIKLLDKMFAKEI